MHGTGPLHLGWDVLRSGNVKSENLGGAFDCFTTITIAGAIHGDRDNRHSPEQFYHLAGDTAVVNDVVAAFTAAKEIRW
jgi:hypothetical protein